MSAISRASAGAGAGRVESQGTNVLIGPCSSDGWPRSMSARSSDGRSRGRSPQSWATSPRMAFTSSTMPKRSKRAPNTRAFRVANSACSQGRSDAAIRCTVPRTVQVRRSGGADGASGEAGHARATLTFGGLRLGEAQALRWRDVDLARGTITVRGVETDAGVRVVTILPVLSDELGNYQARIDPASDAFVFCTTTGHRLGATNIRRRVLDKAVEHANTQLVVEGFEPLPDGLTPHSLRRTFASLLFAIGETPPYVMAQMGHTTPNLTLAIYARQMDRRDGEPERLRALLDGRGWRRGAHFCGHHAGDSRVVRAPTSDPPAEVAWQ